MTPREEHIQLTIGIARPSALRAKQHWAKLA